jgi:thioredoxin reductase (NADPH)
MTEQGAVRAARPAIVTVDDDPSVSRSVARDLRRRYGEGYRVVRAESGGGRAGGAAGDQAAR